MAPTAVVGPGRRSGPGCPRRPGRAASPRPAGRRRSRSPAGPGRPSGRPRAARAGRSPDRRGSSSAGRRRIARVGDPDREPFAGLVPADVEVARSGPRDSRVGSAARVRCVAVGRPARDPAVAATRRIVDRSAGRRPGRSRSRRPRTSRSGRRPGATARSRRRSVSPLAGSRRKSDRLVFAVDDVVGLRPAADDAVAVPGGEHAQAVRREALGLRIADAPDVDVGAGRAVRRGAP